MKTSKRTIPIKDPAARKQFWLKHVKAYLRSGKSIKDYCLEAGINHYSLRDWQTKFKKEFGAEWLDSLRTSSAKSQDFSQPKFVEVQLNDRPQTKPASEIITTLWEIKTPAGYCVSIRGGMPPSNLVALLKQMKEAEC
jgi:transposase-like protein